jgi:hypothetical protein
VDWDNSHEISVDEFIHWAKDNKEHLQSFWWKGAPVDQAASLSLAPVGSVMPAVPLETFGGAFSFSDGDSSGGHSSFAAAPPPPVPLQRSESAVGAPIDLSI